MGRRQWLHALHEQDRLASAAPDRRQFHLDVLVASRRVVDVQDPLEVPRRSRRPRAAAAPPRPRPARWRRSFGSRRNQLQRQRFGHPDPIDRGREDPSGIARAFTTRIQTFDIDML